MKRIGLSGTRRITSSITASDRASLSGASMTATKSPNSTATLLCDPPPTSHTPSATTSDATRMGGTVAVCTTSGTVSAASATFTCTSSIVVRLKE